MFKGHGKHKAGLWPVMTATALALAIGITPAFALADEVIAEGDDPNPQELVVSNDANEVNVPTKDENDSPAQSGNEGSTAPAAAGSESPTQPAPVEPAPAPSVPESTPVENVNPVDTPASDGGAVDVTPVTTPDDVTTPTTDDEQTVADDATTPQDQQSQEIASGAGESAAQEAPADSTPVATAAPASGKLNAAEDKAERTIKDGLYSINPVGASGKVATVNKGSAKNGTAVVSAASKGEDYQKFYIEYDENAGFYRIHILKSGKNVVVDSKKIVESDVASASQLWEILASGSGMYAFKNQETGLLMTLSGNNFIAAADTGSGASRKDTQKFSLTALDILSNGFYFIRSKADSKLAVTVSKNSSSEKAKIVLAKTGTAQNQKFQIVRVGGVGSGLYRIRTTSSGGWLTEIGTKSTSQVKQKGNSKTAVSNANTWKVCWNGSYWSLRNVESGYILSFAHAESGKQLKVHKPNGQDKQHFDFVPTQLVANGNYYVKSLLTDKYMTVSGSSLKNGGNVVADGSGKTNSKKFKITKSGAYYTIANLFSGKFLSVKDGSTKSGANVLQWGSKSTLGQKWDIRIGDGGGLVFVNVKTGMALNVSGKKKNVSQSTANTSKAQKWSLSSTTVNGWYHEGAHWRYKSTNAKAKYENDINQKGKSLGHYDVIYDIWKKINRKRSGTKYLIASSWDSCYVVVFEGKKGNWKPLYGFNCGNGKGSIIEAEVREEKPGSNWRWNPSWDRYLAKSNVKRRMPEFPPNNSWARKLGRTYKKSRVRRVNANEKYFTSVSWTLGYHTYLHSKKELGRHVSHGCQRLAPKWAKWIYKNARPMTRCTQLRTKEYK